MLWEVEIFPVGSETDFEGQRMLASARHQGISGIKTLTSARTFLIQGDLTRSDAQRAAEELLVDPVTEQFQIHELPAKSLTATQADEVLCLNVLFHPGVTDSVAENAARAMSRLHLNVTNVATCRRYWVGVSPGSDEINRLTARILANEAIEYVVTGPLQIADLSVGSDYIFKLTTVAIRNMNDEELMVLSRQGQFYLSLAEMQTVRNYFRSMDRDPTDIELETIAQTWSEHCSHKTLAGPIHYVETSNGNVLRDVHFRNMLKETIFSATEKIREKLGTDDWCVSVFKDNAGIVRFDEKQNLCIKVETHNHPSAIEPYGGANTGLGGVIRDPLGTGLGARPVCSTNVFCFARPNYPTDQLPPGVLHPKAVMQGVVAGVRDYGNRMGIPTVNGAVCFDDRYLGNPLVYCGNVAMIPANKCEKHVNPGDLIVAVGGRTGRDGIHGATFSSVELTEQSEHISGGAVQIGNPVTEKMILDVILEARDRGLYSAITDCGAGGFSSAVGEMGEETGAEVWLEKAPLKYSGLSYTEIWISEAQERMVLAVPPQNGDEFHNLCAAEGVEATVIGRFTDSKKLVLKYNDHEVGNLNMEFLHNGRPPVIRKAIYEIRSQDSPRPENSARTKTDYSDDLKKILGSLNVSSKEWIIRQYDHEVQAGSVIKPLVGINDDGPSDAAVVRPDLTSKRGIAVSCGINPHFGDYDPYWMAASAIDEAVRNCVATGADPDRIAILDNFCWGNTERAETLGTLVRAAVACQNIAVAYGTPFVSGKDSLNNEFSYQNAEGNRRTVAIPSTLLITALGQVNDVEQCVTMDIKGPGNLLYLIGETKNEMGGSHFNLVHGLTGGHVPTVDPELAPGIFRALHQAIRQGLILSCHDLSEGGLAVAAAEMAFSGDSGVDLRLTAASAIELFSESNTRFLAEVSPAHAEQFESCFRSAPLQRVGETTAGQCFRVLTDTGTIISCMLEELHAAWKAPLNF